MWIVFKTVLSKAVMKSGLTKDEKLIFSFHRLSSSPSVQLSEDDDPRDFPVIQSLLVIWPFRQFCQHRHCQFPLPTDSRPSGGFASGMCLAGQPTGSTGKELAPVIKAHTHPLGLKRRRNPVWGWWVVWRELNQSSFCHPRTGQSQLHDSITVGEAFFIPVLTCWRWWWWWLKKKE